MSATPLAGVKVLGFSHTVMVLGEAGFTTAEIAGLAEAGVIAARTGESG